MKNTLIFVLIALIFGACKKKGNNANNANSVEITIDEPSVGDTVSSYSLVHMEGTISGDGEMKGYRLQIKNDATGVELYSNLYDVKSNAYNFHDHWINSLDDTTTVTVRVVAQKNDEGGTETKEIKVVCLP